MRLRWGLAVVVLVVGGCGVPAQDSPVGIDPEVVPSRLRETALPREASPPTAEPGQVSVVVNFVRKDRLVRSVREVPNGPAQDRLAAIVAALVAGPTERERASGISSALPVGLELTVSALEGSRAVIGLTGEADGSAAENVLAVGQIVLTATAIPTVKEVSFERDGLPVEALLADGALTMNPLTAADYAALRAG
ncbi:GerMN domain-containing protein [Kribbella sp. NPDC051770]|uniref:GerMN domain-containing protein n=1 Tax=Kribbella sp. NPDC051770 TaxID=3155413 RepID=UPI003443CA18